MVKDPPASAGDAGSVPGSGRSPGERNGDPLQDSCLENSMDSMKSQKDMTQKDEPPPDHKVSSMLLGKKGGQLLINSFRKNKTTGPK